MSTATHEPDDSPARPAGRAAQFVEVLLVLLVFALYAGWPVPDPNEPYYLTKAKHFWDPSWIENDFFLDSADSHWTFYFTVGWLSRFMSLPALAWTGRILTWALMAIAWRRLSWTLIPRSGAAVLSAALMIALNDQCQMAGEWVVGGFEAKGLAYALVFAALADVIEGRWNRAWALLGAACAFHILVGGWAAVAVMVCWFFAPAGRATFRSMLPGLAAAAVLSLPGLLPAVWLSHGATQGVQLAAHQIYVYERLPHHLSFFSFSKDFRIHFAILVFIWGVIGRLRRNDARDRCLRRVVNTSLGLVAIGIGLSAWGLANPGEAAELLRFYWFRLADVFLPAGVALSATAAAFLVGAEKSVWRTRVPFTLAAVATLLLAPELWQRATATVPRADKPGKTTNLANWRDACAWIVENTPANARFLTPRQCQTFKWYTGRSEVATWKDMPQDAESIVDWWIRLRNVYGTDDPAGPDGPWHDSLALENANRLGRVAQLYDADFIISDKEPPLDFPCVYRNETYAVYSIYGTPEE